MGRREWTGGQRQGANDAILTRVHRQLQQSRSQVDPLVAARHTRHAAEAELAERRRSPERSEDTHTVLAQQASAMRDAQQDPPADQAA